MLILCGKRTGWSSQLSRNSKLPILRKPCILDIITIREDILIPLHMRLRKLRLAVILVRQLLHGRVIPHGLDPLHHISAGAFEREIVRAEALFKLRVSHWFNRSIANTINKRVRTYPEHRPEERIRNTEPPKQEPVVLLAQLSQPRLRCLSRIIPNCK
jgi:hypothetical protein